MVDHTPIKLTSINNIVVLSWVSREKWYGYVNDDDDDDDPCKLPHTLRWRKTIQHLVKMKEEWCSVVDGKKVFGAEKSAGEGKIQFHENKEEEEEAEAEEGENREL